MDLYLDEIIKKSNLTKLQLEALCLTNPSLHIFFDNSEIKSLQLRPTGEVSTIRRQARNNVRESIYTMILGFYVGFLKEGYVPNLMEISYALKKLKEQNIFSETALDNLDNIINAILI